METKLKQIIDSILEKTNYKIVYESDDFKEINIMKDEHNLVFQFIQTDDGFIELNTYYANSYIQDNGWDRLARYDINSDFTVIVNAVLKEI